MDDQHAQFLILVGDLCVGAELAGLEVELESTDGSLLRGIPSALGGPGTGDEVDGTGYRAEFRLNGTAMRLNAVVACGMRAPA